MAEELEIETYIFVSSFSIGIYLFDVKNLKNLFKEEIILQNDNDKLELSILNTFLDENFFKIEKLLGKFIKNVFLIIEHKKINSVCFSIKKKNYQEFINKKHLENLLTDAKDIYKENYQDEKIMHIMIDKYVVDEEKFTFFQNNFMGENFCLELKFISIPILLTNEIEKVLEKYHIKISSYISGDYVKNLFKEEKIELTEMVYKVRNGFNTNEALIVPKNSKKTGFFEKFFQLFG